METSSCFNFREKLLRDAQIILIPHVQAQQLQSGFDNSDLNLTECIRGWDLRLVCAFRRGEGASCVHNTEPISSTSYHGAFVTLLTTLGILHRRS
jgi:hypothetical protein